MMTTMNEERAAIEAAYASVVDAGWSSVKDMGIKMFQAGATWQRAQSAPVGFDFTIDDRGKCRVLVWSGNNGCRPASAEECTMWDAISAQQCTQAAVVPEAKVTGAWESARIGDFNAGWNACRDSVFTLMKKAAYMELDTTKRSIAVQDGLRAMLSADPSTPPAAQGAVPDGYMPIPTVEQLAEALANVRCFHDMSAELIAPELLRNLLAAAPATPAAQGAVPDVSAMARVLSDRSADACNIDRDDNWAMYGQEYIEDVRAMLAASTGQEVEK